MLACLTEHYAKMKFSIKKFFSKCDYIRSFLQVWPHLLKKSLIENYISCVVKIKWYKAQFHKVILWHVFALLLMCKYWKTNIGIRNNPRFAVIQIQLVQVFICTVYKISLVRSTISSSHNYWSCIW